MKHFIITFIICIVSCTNLYAQENMSQAVEGTIQGIKYVDMNDSDYTQVKQDIIVKLKNGKQVNATNMLTGNPFYDMSLERGMTVFLQEENNNGINYSVEDIKRSNILVWLSLIFSGLLIYVGKKKGLYSIIAIIITCLLIFNVLSPLVLHGINPIAATLLICLLSTATTMYFVGGFNKKSTSATLGCILSIVFAGILSYLTVQLAHLNGFINESCMFLYSAHPELDFISILISVMILATLGAVMDIAMSISSTINEIYTIDNTQTIKELFASGMNVGRDIIGTMANTLILVYLGGSLPLLLLSANINFQKFINLNQVVTEISSALIGSIAIVVCVPITAFVASHLVRCNSTEPEDILKS